MKIDLNVHINSWIHRKERAIDPMLIQLKGNDEQMIVDTSKKIYIKFDYPLTESTTLEFEYAKPWRLHDLLECISVGYLSIYDEEDRTRTLPAVDMGSIFVNRPKTDGKYGIWGHILNDLFIEGVYKGSDGVWLLEMGS